MELGNNIISEEMTVLLTKRQEENMEFGSILSEEEVKKWVRMTRLGVKDVPERNRKYNGLQLLYSSTHHFIRNCTDMWEIFVIDEYHLKKHNTWISDHNSMNFR